MRMRAWICLLLAACGEVEPVEDPLVSDCLDLDGDAVCDHDRADWSEGALVPEGAPRTDIFGLGDDLPEVRHFAASG